jgi:hypothetical protein
LTNLPVRAQKAMVTLWAHELHMRVSTGDAKAAAVAELIEAAARAVRELAS